MAAKVRLSGNYFDEQDFGTKVHKAIDKEIKSLKGDKLISELTLVPDDRKPAFYGMSGSTRLDVLEKSSPSTVCVYDHKAGNAGLKPRQVVKIMLVVQRNFPGTRRMILIEVRPRG